jgi:hypothetical protein
VAWLSPDPTDDEPRQFLSYLMGAFRAEAAVGSFQRVLSPIMIFRQVDPGANVRLPHTSLTA